MNINYVLIIIGIVDIVLTSMLMFKKGFAENYVEKSPKAYIWRKIFGQEKALKIIKNYLAPIAFVFGVILIFLGFK